MISEIYERLLIKDTERCIHKSKEKPYGNTFYEKRQVVAVMTTIPARLPVLHHSIQSILRQTIRPHKIVVYLGDELFENVPLTKELKELQKYGVEYRYVKDIRVHTKYFYALQEFKDSYVMTFDDDQMYRPDLLKCLLETIERYPNAIICSRAHWITEGDNAGFGLYNHWRWNYCHKIPSHMLLPTGVGGVLYDPRLFPDETFDKNIFLKLTPNADDLWLKCMEILAEIPAVTLTKKKWYLNVDNSQEVSLRSQNVAQSRNDVYWKNLMEYYHITYDHIQKMEQ